ncbi:sulfite exporter TauE/SafE family protein [soil metagenome]
MHYILLFLTGLVAGGINSIAGGGIFVVIPAMLLSGLTGKQANASGSFAVWVGQATSLFENRRLLPKNSSLVRQIIGIGVVGSIIGALLLIWTPNVDFEHALPWLNLAAVLLFTSGPWLKKHIGKKTAPRYAFPLFLLAVGIYGGYFGGGLGMLILAVLGVSNAQDIQHQNAIKLLMASLINAVSLSILLFAQLIIWRSALPAGLGALVGGYAGSRYSRRLPGKALRTLIIFIGVATTVYLFVRFN